jgi:phage terminase small subunit
MPRKKGGKKRKEYECTSPTNQYGLTDLQWRFVQEYPLNDFNGTRAAKAAGYKGKRPDIYACETLKKPAVREAIQDLLRERTEYYELSKDRILQEWMTMAFVNFQDLGDNAGHGFTFEQFSKLPKATVNAVEEVSHTVGRDGSVMMNVKLQKVKALTMLTKMMGLLEPPEKEDSKGAFVEWLKHQEQIHEKEEREEEE